MSEIWITRLIPVRSFFRQLRSIPADVISALNARVAGIILANYKNACRMSQGIFMTRHTFTFLLCLSSLFLKPVVAEELTIDFTYERNVNIGSISPILKLAPFADDRGLADPNTIVGDDRAQLPLADLIRDAFEQGFNKGGIEFVDAAADMEIVGTLLSSELETVDRAGVPNLQLTIRAGIELRGGGRGIWSTTLFGRGRVPVKEGLSGAVKASFERLVRELLRDDYFLLELQ